jgi:hypothetical protein
MLLWRLSFSHLQRSLGAILSVKLRLLKASKGGSTRFSKPLSSANATSVSASSHRHAPTAGYSSSYASLSRRLVAPPQILS